ncbi:MAG: deoxyribonuclease II family protein [Proteobacteria bacterium]|nr:deoxyribonuclease II family protein [Pseudomonadota bacterium]
MTVSALDERGQPVDWFFIYKVPQLAAGANTDMTTGYEYVYYDSRIDEQKTANKRNIDKSPFVLNSEQGALNETLNAVFDNPEDTTGWILYNDEKPGDVTGKDNGALGHTKGVLAFDTKTKTGYWLLHSWPKFAEPKAKGDPTPKFGQTYLCLSLTFDTLEKIAAQMIDRQQPQTYLNRVDCLANNKASPLYKLSQTINPNAVGASGTLDLKTAGGMAFKVIAKNRLWNQDFWNGLVGPTLGDDMDVDTWIRGAVPPVADTDGVHKTFDIKYINLGPLGIHMAWPETHDHAKWGITTHSNWICVGDINRMISQRKRGGGTIAFQNQTLWQGLSKTDLLLAPPGLTRDNARGLIHSTHFDPHDQLGSSPQPKIHSMSHLPPRTGVPFRGKPMPLDPDPAQPTRPLSPRANRSRPKKSAKKSSTRKK